jgi:hypothetical protein
MKGVPNWHRNVKDSASTTCCMLNKGLVDGVKEQACKVNKATSMHLLYLTDLESL